MSRERGAKASLLFASLLAVSACSSTGGEPKSLMGRFERWAQGSGQTSIQGAAERRARPADSGRLALAIELAAELGRLEDAKHQPFVEALQKGRIFAPSQAPLAAWSALALVFDAIELDQGFPAAGCADLHVDEITAIPNLLMTLRLPTDMAHIEATLWYARRLAESRRGGVHLFLGFDLARKTLELARDEGLCLWREPGARPNWPERPHMIAYAREVRCTAEVMEAELASIPERGARAITQEMVDAYLAYHDKLMERLESRPGETSTIFAELAAPPDTAPLLVRKTAVSYLGDLLDLPRVVERLMDEVTCEPPEPDVYARSAREHQILATHGAEVSHDMLMYVATAPSTIEGVRVFGPNPHHLFGGDQLHSGDRILEVAGQPLSGGDAATRVIRGLASTGGGVELVRGRDRMTVQVRKVGWGQPSGDATAEAAAPDATAPEAWGDERASASPDENLALQDDPASQGAGPEPQNDWVESVGPYEYRLRRPRFLEVLAEPRTATDTRVAPHYRDNQYVGFKLVGVRPGSLYRMIGLRSGDVILSVDGAPIDAPDKVTRFVEALKSAQGRLVIDLERRGQTHQVVWTFVESP